MESVELQLLMVEISDMSLAIRCYCDNAVCDELSAYSLRNCDTIPTSLLT